MLFLTLTQLSLLTAVAWKLSVATFVPVCTSLVGIVVVSPRRQAGRHPEASTNKKVSYREQIAPQHSCHKFVGHGMGVVDRVNIFLSSSLITMQNLVSVCHTEWAVEGKGRLGNVPCYWA